jgi:hypothetical protein
VAVAVVTAVRELTLNLVVLVEVVETILQSQQVLVVQELRAKVTQVVLEHTHHLTTVLVVVVVLVLQVVTVGTQVLEVVAQALTHTPHGQRQLVRVLVDIMLAVAAVVLTAAVLMVRAVQVAAAAE